MPSRRVRSVQFVSGGVSLRFDTTRYVTVSQALWIPPGQKHWHGASPTTAMTHIAITEQADGKAVDWLEKVSDTQYQKEP